MYYENTTRAWWTCKTGNSSLCYVVKPTVFTTTLIRNNEINFSPVEWNCHCQFHSDNLQSQNEAHYSSSMHFYSALIILCILTNVWLTLILTAFLDNIPHVVNLEQVLSTWTIGFNSVSWFLKTEANLIIWILVLMLSNKAHFPLIFKSMHPTNLNVLLFKELTSYFKKCWYFFVKHIILQ